MSHVSSSSRIAAAALMLLVATHAVDAQSTATAPTALPDSSRHWELLFSSGALLPTGAQRQALKNAPLSTGQISYVAGEHLAITSMFGWARSRDLVTAGSPRVSVFTYDVGVEARVPQWRGDDVVSFTPFAGIGGGGRSFDHQGGDIEATHAPTGYAAVGGELAIARARVRLEVRDYLTAMKPITGAGSRAMRNDVSIIVGLRLAAKKPSAD